MTTLRPKPKLAEVQVLRRRDLTPDLLFMWIERPADFTFKAGQYCTIGRDGIERAYSIVSAPHEPDLELFVELVPPPDGVLTPKLWELEPGDTVSIRPRAKGLFTMDESLPNQFLVATVTGVVPYVSFIRDYIHNERSGHRFFILLGASYSDELACDEELRRIAAERPGLLTFVPTVSRADESRNHGWQGETGRVNAVVEKYIEKFSLSPQDTLVYACGHPGMIENVKERLVPRGFRVEEERFWKDD